MHRPESGPARRVNDGRDLGATPGERSRPVETPYADGPGTTSWADLLALVSDLRRIAFDTSIDDADRARRTRDRFREWSGEVEP